MDSFREWNKGDKQNSNKINEFKERCFLMTTISTLSVQVLKNILTDYTSPHCDLDLEDGKPIFSHDTPVRDDAPPYQVWLQNAAQFRKYRAGEKPRHTVK